jgi:predicted ribosomally synthesized peptide with SipW-like signal peptide
VTDTITDAVTTASTNSHRAARGSASRRLRAILAGGLVLGVGAAVTLAAWNDSEFAQGTFTAGAFNMEGTVDGSTWTENATAGSAATLPFTLTGSRLSPSDTTYSPFAIRLAAISTNAATVTMTSASTTGDVTHLTYSVLVTTSFGCTSSTTGTVLVPAGTAVGTVPASTTLALSPGVSPSAGAPAYLCFRVTADSTLAQGQSGTATWNLTAQSS